VLNAADEVAVHSFLDGKIGFSSISVVVERTLADVEVRPLETLEDVRAVDREARSVATAHLGASC
jgi:1-deoxy-D-xylulose-5-phosphate reductoisomerase